MTTELLNEMHKACEEFIEFPTVEKDRQIRTLCIKLIINSPDHLKDSILKNANGIIYALDEYKVNEVLSIIEKLQAKLK